MLNRNVLSILVAVITPSLYSTPSIAAINYTRLGTGTGVVTFTPGGSCPNNCSQNYDFATQVTLTATPSANSIFTGWSGACSGTEGCTVTVDGEEQVTATFSATTSILATAAGYYHDVVLKDDGTVWTWGSNGSGQLGDGTYFDRDYPVKIPGLSGVTAISSRGNHTVALKNDGTVWAWGGNFYGQLGDGTTIDRTMPVQMVGIEGVIAISAGYDHTIILKEDGTVWGTGDNCSGQLGDIGNGQLTPVKVPGISGITSIATGTAGYTMALKNDGTVWGWGNNGCGQLGNGTTLGTRIPAQVNGITDVVIIATGYCHTEALKNDGTIWGWGHNFYGELGDGTTINRTTPVQATLITGASAIAAGENHTLALTSNGTIYGWGWNRDGQLGDGSNNSSSSPVQVVESNGTVALAAGGLHSIALKADGSLWAWGTSAGQLGVNRSTPNLIQGIGTVLIPFAVISGTPSILTNSTNATLTVGGEGVDAYRYKLDNGIYSGEIPVTTPIIFNNLAEGPHIVAVRGRNSSGTWQSAATTTSWTVDVTPPTAIILGAPTGVTNSNYAAISVKLSYAWATDVVAYKFKVDGGNYSAERNYENFLVTDLVEGPHTISVIGKDSAGNWQATPTTASWEVHLLPKATISGKPTSPTKNASATLTIGGTDIAAYKYKLDTGSYSNEIPVATLIGLSDLSDGVHTVSVLGRNSAGEWQVTPTTVNWSVDVPVRIPGGGGYVGIQAAYAALLGDNVLQIKGGTLVENLVFNRNLTITFRGGFDSASGTCTGFTNLQGSLVIKDGTVIVENLTLR